MMIKKKLIKTYSAIHLSQYVLCWLFLIFIYSCNYKKSSKDVAQEYLEQKLKTYLDSAQNMFISVDTSNKIDVQKYFKENQKFLEPRFIKEYACNDDLCTQVWAVQEKYFVVYLKKKDKKWVVDSDDFLDDNE